MVKLIMPLHSRAKMRSSAHVLAVGYTACALYALAVTIVGTGCSRPPRPTLTSSEQAAIYRSALQLVEERGYRGELFILDQAEMSVGVARAIREYLPRVPAKLAKDLARKAEKPCGVPKELARAGVAVVDRATYSGISWGAKGPFGVLFSPIGVGGDGTEVALYVSVRGEDHGEGVYVLCRRMNGQWTVVDHKVRVFG